MKRRLLIARALVNEPDLVVLDEPTTGLDPQARLAVWRALDAPAARSGVTLLLTTHYMEEAARLCDRLLIMDDGRIVTEGEPRRWSASTSGARSSSWSWARVRCRGAMESLDGRGRPRATTAP